MVRSNAKKLPKNFSKLNYCVLAVSTLALVFCISLALIDSKSENAETALKTMKYWIQTSQDPRNLVNLIKVFNVLEWKETKTWNDADWLWFYDYPFTKYSTQMKNLKINQRVNHFPGSGWVTSKSLMSRSVKSEHIPKSFYSMQDADAMLKYFIANPQKKFVQKNINNRRVKIVSNKEINLNVRDTFVQEFIDNPLLLDGYKFDVGMFVVVTSIDPLRLYIYDGQMVLRFCLEKYHPFDAKNINKYVIHDGFQYGYTLPFVGKHINVTKFSLRSAFEAVMLNKGYNVQKVFKQMEEIIVDVYSQQEMKLLQKVSYI